MMAAHERITVLYVDDEPGNLSGFKSTFRREFNVLIANSGAEALDLLDKHDVHVVISDQRMPGMEGADLLAIVKDRHPQAVRMLMTAYADVQAVIDAVNKGNIFGYATKPYDPADLRIRIEQAASLATARRDRDRTHARYKQVFENAGDPIVIVDDKAMIVQANPATERLLGFPAGSLTGTNFLDLLEHKSDLVRVLRKHRQGSDFANVDLSLRTTRGTVVDCLLTATYVGKGTEGRATYQAVFKDITDRKQEELRLRKLNEDLDKRVAIRTRQLREAIDDLASFSYTVAHDLRSPLKNIRAMSALLKEQESGSEGIAPRIESGTARMLDLVDDLLRFALTNKTEVARETIELRSIVCDVIENNVPAEQRSRISVDIPEGTTAPVDRAMLKVLFVNLIGNALKFSRDRQDAQVRVCHQRELEAHHLWVSDNGVGFNAAQGQDPFGAFKRLHRTDKFEGSGVGLSIVQRIVKKHGGEAWAESAPGKGCTIHFRIPSEIPKDSALPFEERA